MSKSEAAYLFFFNDTATTEIYTLFLHDALPISPNATYAGSRSAAEPRSLLEHQLLRPLRGLHHGLDQRHAELPLLQLEDPVDGAARRRGDGILEQGRVIAGLECDLSGAEQRLRGY